MTSPLSAFPFPARAALLSLLQGLLVSAMLVPVAPPWPPGPLSSAVPRHCPQSLPAMSCQTHAHLELSILWCPCAPWLSPPQSLTCCCHPGPSRGPHLSLDPTELGWPWAPSPSSPGMRDEPLPFSMPGAAPLLPSPDSRDKSQPEQRFPCVPSPCQSRAGQVWSGLLSLSLLLLPWTVGSCGRRSRLPGSSCWDDVEPSLPRCLLACLQGRSISQQQLEVGFQAGDRWTLTKAGNGCKSPLEEE